MQKPTRLLSSQLKELAGQEVAIAGWLHKRRQLGGISFILVRDRAGLVQNILIP